MLDREFIQVKEDGRQMCKSYSYPMPPEDQQINKHSFPLKAVILLICVAALGGAIYYYIALREKSAPAGPAFDPAKQFVPEGAEASTVDQSLAAFGVSKPLPFFDERNVVWSLRYPQGEAATSTSTQAQAAGQRHTVTSLEYRIPGLDIWVLRDAFRAYFKEMGWLEARSANPNSEDKKNTFLTLFFNNPRSFDRLEILLTQADAESLVSLFSLSPFQRPSSP